MSVDLSQAEKQTVIPKDLIPAIIFFLKKFGLAFITIFILLLIIIPLLTIAAKLITREVQFFWNNFF